MGDVNDFIPRRLTLQTDGKLCMVSSPDQQRDPSLDVDTTNSNTDQNFQSDVDRTETCIDGPKDVTDSNRNAETGNDIDGQSERSEFGVCGWLSLLIPGLTLLFFIADIVTDVRLAIKYWTSGEYYYFYFTLAFLIGPGLLVIYADLSWWYIDRSSHEADDANESHAGEEMTDLTERSQIPEAKQDEQGPWSALKVFGRIILGLLSLGIIVRIIQHMCYKYKKRTEQSQKDYFKEKAKNSKRDYVALNFICAFTETYSQAVLQLYIFALKPTTLDSRIGQSIITSLLFMPLAYADHYRSTRAQPHAGVEKKDMHLVVYFFYYLGVLGGMTFRMLSMSMFVAALPLVIGVPLVNLHFVVVFFWLWCYHKPKFEGLLHTKSTCMRKVGKIFYTALYSITCMLFYVNVYERDIENYPSKWRVIGYNVVLYMESAVFITFGFLRTDVDIKLYAMALFISALLHLIFIANYYNFLHPTIGICYTCKDSHNERVNNVGESCLSADPLNNRSIE